MTVTTRFAPSPTGRLHVGNIRTALHNALFAQRHGGRFLLRIDDTDAARSTAENDQAIHDDLAWLGLHPESTVRQSDRFALYAREFDRLRLEGRVYACYESPEELDLRRKVLLGRGLPPVYERRAADDPAPVDTAPHWRFRLDHGSPIGWTDLVRGPQKFDPALISDPVVRRADGSWLYLLPSVIDDIDMGITHIVRGEDHVSNSATQVQMFEALGAPVPHFAHEALLVAAEGKLSKRFGAIGVGEMKAAGLEPMALLSLLARLGTSQPVEARLTLSALANGFDFAHFGRAPAHFNLADVEDINRKIIHNADYDEISSDILADISADDFELLKGNVDRLDELRQWVPVLDGDLPPTPIPDGDRGFLAEAARIAATLDWSADPWPALTSALKAITDRKGRALFHPLRLALTGRDSGPEMAPLLKRIGKRRALARLTVPDAF